MDQPPPPDSETGCGRQAGRCVRTNSSNLFGRGHVAADAAEEFHRRAAFEREADIVHHLAGAQFDDGEGLGVFGEIAKSVEWGTGRA